MSDVYCSTCREPYDTHHMRWDEIHETDLDDYQIKYWKQNQETIKLDDFAQTSSITYRQAFAANGWEFGNTVFNIRRCPNCPDEATINETKDAVSSMLEEMLEGDSDGFIATMEDYEDLGEYFNEK